MTTNAYKALDVLNGLERKFRDMAKDVTGEERLKCECYAAAFLVATLLFEDEEALNLCAMPMYAEWEKEAR